MISQHLLSLNHFWLHILGPWWEGGRGEGGGGRGCDSHIPVKGGCLT